MNWFPLRKGLKGPETLWTPTRADPTTSSTANFCTAGFNALVVRSTLKQAGFPFGSGTRTMWFAADRGLVKLEFRHGDGSVSVVELVKK